ncbi:phage holin family protein [Sporosarcina aquimarina]|uniref:phage holin family protein n=1 Tax=Sporosarcina aquimarina TaxID=114975 RepID=UPI001C8D1982|nr:phage holin family protein [Sporosarcina aquimarina]MBY0221954.1 phage holin family protein [Sporosarcina aquimarina]
MEKLLFLLSVIGSWLAFLVGGWHISLTVLVVFMIIEIVTSFLKAITMREIDSVNGYKNFIKKFGIILAIIMANMADLLTGSDLLFRSVTILFFIGLIGLEIIENLGHIGVPLPAQLTKYLQQISDEGKEENE